MIAVKSYRKWVLAGLSLCCLASLLLGVTLAANEFAMPADRQLDELRLLDADLFSQGDVDTTKMPFTSPEGELAVLARCRLQKGAGAEADCLKVAENLVAQAPMNGAAWVELAREQAAAGRNSTEIETSLMRSQDLSRYEGWILTKRVGLALSLWPSLGATTQSRMTDEILEHLGSWEFARFMANSYVNNLFIRQTISDIVAKAPAAQQKNFLGLVRKLST